MLAVARTVDQTIDWRQGNATALPVDAGEHFTVVTCHRGLQFMPDKPAVIREMRRVLAPGGRVAIATWSSLDDLPGMRELNAVVERHVGPIVDTRVTASEMPGRWNGCWPRAASVTSTCRRSPTTCRSLTAACSRA
jgi:ubiquinone/menaquinone biosynthesis C-methylase UbiE